jgi:signal peptidase I
MDQSCYRDAARVLSKVRDSAAVLEIVDKLITMKRFGFTILILVLLLTISCKDITFRQTSNSMSPTIKAGDVVYCDKIQSKISAIERLDVVIITSPDEKMVASDGPDARYIFRVVGIGGDKIQVNGGRFLLTMLLWAGHLLADCTKR